MAIPDAPIGRSDAVGVWTGKELIVAGGQGGCTPASAACGIGGELGAQSQGAAFDPTTSTWRLIAPSPSPVFANARNVQTAWDGSGATFVGPGVGTTGDEDLIQTYHPDTDAWTTQVFPGSAVALTTSGAAVLGATNATPASAGGPSTLQSVSRDNDHTLFKAIGDPLKLSGSCSSQVHATGRGVIVIDCGETEQAREDAALSAARTGSQPNLTPEGQGTDSVVAFDAATLQWTELAGVPSDLKYMFWTDRGLLALGLQRLLELAPGSSTPPSTEAPTTSAPPTTLAPTAGAHISAVVSRVSTGWQAQLTLVGAEPGETVHYDVTGPGGGKDLMIPHVASADGTVEATYLSNDGDADGTYVLRARGSGGTQASIVLYRNSSGLSYYYDGPCPPGEVASPVLAPPDCVATKTPDSASKSADSASR